ncbi:hypothetical protein [Mesonia aquimarina]|uniref:hypothetical protein n=1 Tax=Mesonia aquimarina TaxID=1504967 RepID=UPI000EF55FD9|nr:hypothetical protein [Mesonia aquimarina]
MKNTLYLLSLIIAAFLLPMLTSWLYEWQFIASWWPRWVLIIFLMLTELIIIGYMFIEAAKKLKK